MSASIAEGPATISGSVPAAMHGTAGPSDKDGEHEVQVSDMPALASDSEGPETLVAAQAVVQPGSTTALAHPGDTSAGAAEAAHPAGAVETTDTAPLVRRPLALSPSRASDFKTCPLLYRYRAVDRLPEPPSAPAVRGTLVHSVLERMFGQPATERTPELTVAQVIPVWEQMIADYPELLSLLPDDELPDWLGSAEDLVRSYFTLEDPRRFTPEACELAIEVEITGGVPLRGFIDRVDLAPTGELRVVDYKTGRSPGPDFELRALYQLKFYALMMYRLRGIVPTQLKLIYLADNLSLQYTPTETELLRFEHGVVALWTTMTSSLETGDFPASPSSMCGYCAHQAICPAYGGTPLPYPGYPGRDFKEVEIPLQETGPSDGSLTEAAVKVPVDL